MVFNGLACLLSRLTFELTQNCLVSAVVELPVDFATSVVRDLQLLPMAVGHSAIFWPGTHFVNHMFVHRWSPNFRSTVDAAVVFLWDMFVLGGCMSGCSVPLAIGPILSGKGPAGLAHAAHMSVDCAEWGAIPIIEAMGKSTGTFGEAVARALVTLIRYSGKGLALVVQGIVRVVVCILNEIRWHVYTLFWLLVTAVRLVLYVITWVTWKAIGAPFAYFDSMKWWLLMFWVPQLFPYNSQPYWYLWPWNPNDDWAAPWRLSPNYRGGSMWPGSAGGTRKPAAAAEEEEEDDAAASLLSALATWQVPQNGSAARKSANASGGS
eukprot:TRINITY_DN5043_c2_g1_i2.p1 TRINITY_DN5043_c2_g1~~TRINITY_DN5043_c2_g1_i2.p1  ORF type:complete len:322 (-),score=31.20 TRINITY_DN5043_c2_g1_i2:144-1109(-)